MMRLKHAADRARELMDRHGLDEWTLRFNGARKKLGECRPQQKWSVPYARLSKDSRPDLEPPLD